MAEEITFYTDQASVRVTDKRVIAGSTTYALANITSVSTAVESPSYTGPLLFLAVGAVALIEGVATKSTGTTTFAVLILALGCFWWRGLKPTWHLRIASASGESSPVKSHNQQWIAGIAQAIKKAMIHRV